MFEIIPAIDILSGKCVRLTQGSYNKVKVYSEEPQNIAKSFAQFGAKRLHIIDLDGAKAGKIINFEPIRNIVNSVQIPIEVGGGIRTEDDIRLLLKVGVNRVIIGTSAITNPEFVEKLCKKYKSQVIISIDAKERQVAIEGWKKLSLKDIITFAKELVNLGVKKIIYTDIKSDGMMKGPNFDGIEELTDQIKIKIIAAGGITSISDIKRLKKIKMVEGCIIGKAIYEGKIDLAQAFSMLGS